MKSLMILVAALFSIQAFADLAELENFGPNEGSLRMFVYTPRNVKPDAPLIVLLHGCNQAASNIDDETGFAHVAEKTGSLLLIPEQTKSNNYSTCYNWFLPADFLRGKGESASIAQMIRFLQSKRIASKKKVYVAGLSAGGAMAAVMLATYPDLFSAGATIAGIPYGCARTVVGGFTCMRSINKTGAQWKRLVEKAFHHKGSYPKVMIFQGTSDPFVSPDNAVELKEQWGAVHNTSKETLVIDNSKMIHKSYLNKRGRSLVETVTLKGMGHGLPVDSKNGCGTEGKWIVDHGVCAADLMSKFFGL
jgi:poly(hydroxyalkanoate) depolymerase family esterase